MQLIIAATFAYLHPSLIQWCQTVLRELGDVYCHIAAGLETSIVEDIVFVVKMSHEIVRAVTGFLLVLVHVLVYFLLFYLPKLISVALRNLWKLVV